MILRPFLHTDRSRSRISSAVAQATGAVVDPSGISSRTWTAEATVSIDYVIDTHIQPTTSQRGGVWGRRHARLCAVGRCRRSPGVCGGARPATLSSWETCPSDLEYAGHTPEHVRCLSPIGRASRSRGRDDGHTLMVGDVGRANSRRPQRRAHARSSQVLSASSLTRLRRGAAGAFSGSVCAGA